MSKANEIHEVLKRTAQELEDTKAQDLKILNLTGLSSFTDYFIIATGTSDRHVQAMADKVYIKLKNELELLPLNFEGREQGQWILLDYGDFVIHLFQSEFREYYNLEEFWEDTSTPASRKTSQSRKAASSKKKFS